MARALWVFPGVAALLLVPLPLGGPAQRPSYSAALVEKGDLIAITRASGSLSALVTVDVGSQISGQVKEIFVDFNDSVVQGQVIARIDPEIYEAKLAQSEAEVEIAESLVAVQQSAIERARADLENAKAAMLSARSQTGRAEIAAEDAKRDVDRKRELARRDIISAGDWERTESAYKSAAAQLAATRSQETSQAAAARASEAALRSAEAQLGNALAQVKQRRSAFRQAEIDVERTFIRAPIRGTVVNRSVNRGQTVAAALQAPTLFSIAQDLSKMQIEMSVVEADVSRFSPGQPVQFSVDAYPGRPFAGQIKQIRKVPQVTQNAVTYTVVISTENPDQVLLPGMTANVQVVVATRRGALKVPNAALRYRPAGRLEAMRRRGDLIADTGGEGPATRGRVFILAGDGEVILTPLRLGLSDGQMTEVISGELFEGQRVVVGLAENATAEPAGAM